MSFKIPKQLKCKLCNAKFPNPIHQGARVSASICTPCRHSFFSAKTIRELHINQSEQKFIEKKEEVIMNNNYITLSTYEGL